MINDEADFTDLCFISLIIITGLSVLSYGYGAGYVYLYWREWQIQTSISGSCLLFWPV